jgi:hypothetical protein
LLYNHVAEKEKWEKLLHYTMLFFLLAFFIAIGGILFTRHTAYGITNKGSLFEKIKAIVQQLNFWHLLLISTALQLFFTFLYKKYFFKKGLLLIAVAVHLVLLAWLTLPFTGLGFMPRKKVQHIISSMPEGIFKPYQQSINTNTYISARYDSIIGSAAFYSKQIGYPAQPYYPVILTPTEAFYADSNVVPFINNQSYLFLTSDTTVKAVTNYDSAKIKVVEYTPAFIKAKVLNEQFTYLIFLQNNYPRWKVLVDGRPITHFTAFKTFIGIPLPKGTHEVIYQFDTRSLQMVLYINIAVLILGLLMLTNKKAANSTLV